MKKQTNSKKIAYGGMISALSLVVMLISGIMPFAEYACPALAGILLTILVIEFGKKTALVAYGAISILSLLIVANKEAAVLFVAFLGYYPILKSVLENLSIKKSQKEIHAEVLKPQKRKINILEWVLKFAIFNVAMIACYFVTVNVFGIANAFDDGGIIAKYGMLLLLLAGNVVFFAYDYALTGLIAMYCNKRRK